MTFEPKMTSRGTLDRSSLAAGHFITFSTDAMDDNAAHVQRIASPRDQSQMAIISGLIRMHSPQHPTEKAHYNFDWIYVLLSERDDCTMQKS